MQFDFSDLKSIAESEIEDIKNEEGTNIPRVGALCNATIKRFKGRCVAKAIEQIVLEHDLDITFVCADKMVRKVLGRGINPQILLSAFATENRTAANKIPKEEQLRAIELVETYKDSILEEIEEHTRSLKSGFSAKNLDNASS